MSERPNRSPNAARPIDPRLALIPEELRMGRPGASAYPEPEIARPRSDGPRASGSGAPSRAGSTPYRPGLGPAAIFAALDRLRALQPTLLTVSAAGSQVLAILDRQVPFTAACVMLPDDPEVLTLAWESEHQGTTSLVPGHGYGHGASSTSARLWRVAHAVGTRKLEHRIQIQETHWLVSEVIHAGRSLVIAQSDIARARLSGAPLAARNHLLAVPIPEVDGLLIAARDETPFTDDELVSAAGVAGSQSSALAAAVAVRELARDLEGHLDYPD